MLRIGISGLSRMIDFILHIRMSNNGNDANLSRFLGYI